jgi:putative transposase
MRLRYRFRLYPTPAQREALARAFGCSRVVYNDGLRLREEASKAGLPWVSDGDLRRLVTTEAKRTQRSLSRRQEGSNNRDKQRRKVAKLHARVADARRDFHHQLSARLIRENQAVVAEDLNVAGLGHSNLAKSIHDAGWSSFVAMLEDKAALSRRRVVKIDQWHPSSQLGSVCGQRSGPKGLGALKIRTWSCLACDTEHDRDVNAALNILAAGRAVAACGPDVRPPARAAAGVEAGTALAGAA